MIFKKSNKSDSSLNLLNKWREISTEEEDQTIEENKEEGEWSTGGGEYVKIKQASKKTPFFKESSYNEGNDESESGGDLSKSSFTSKDSSKELDKPFLVSCDKEKVKTALGPGTFIEGKFTFDSPVRIDGELLGEVTSTSALIVGEEASINANIQVGSLIVFGSVTGNVRVRDLVEIRTGGNIEADIQAERLVIEEGGVFNGHCQML